MKHYTFNIKRIHSGFSRHSDVVSVKVSEIVEMTAKKYEKFKENADVDEKYLHQNEAKKPFVDVEQLVFSSKTNAIFYRKIFIAGFISSNHKSNVKSEYVFDGVVLTFKNENLYPEDHI